MPRWVLACILLCLLYVLQQGQPHLQLTRHFAESCQLMPHIDSLQQPPEQYASSSNGCASSQQRGTTEGMGFNFTFSAKLSLPYLVIGSRTSAALKLQALPTAKYADTNAAHSSGDTARRRLAAAGVATEPVVQSGLPNIAAPRSATGPAAAAIAAANPIQALEQRTNAAAAAGDGGDFNIWLYSLISADYDGAALLRHWLRHYTAIGIDRRRFLLLVNHNPANPGVTRGGLDAVVRVLEEEGLTYRLWLGQYSSEGHLALKLQILNEAVRDPQDWILLADSDEFQIYALTQVRLFLQQCDERGQTWVRGFLQDRVSADGNLSRIAEEPSMFEQYPLHCAVLKNTSKGKRKKVAAFKAFLRSNQGNHRVVAPDYAEIYFGPSKPGQLSPRGGLVGGDNLYYLTPYYQHHDRYRYRGMKAGVNPKLWEAVMADYFCLVQHFKWHSGVVRSVQDRLKFYKGDYDEKNKTGLPRYPHYVESQRLLEQVLAKGKVETNAMECQPSATNPRYPFWRAQLQPQSSVTGSSAAQRLQQTLLPVKSTREEAYGKDSQGSNSATDGAEDEVGQDTEWAEMDDIIK